MSSFLRTHHFVQLTVKKTDILNHSLSMKSADASKGLFRRSLLGGIISVAFTIGLKPYEFDWIALWPSIIALFIVFYSKSAFVGLLIGSVCGAILISESILIGAFSTLWERQFWPIFGSPWKLSAILFTLLLGGFVALVEAGGGLQALVKKLLGNHVEDVDPSSYQAAKRMQLTVFGFGLLVFFDGLANTMLIGRLLRTAADRCGVSREKLAYLADTTGSAVACLAFVSTWIAFQLSMIRDGFAQVGQEVNAYALFFRSLPTNFYCWFALIMAAVSIFREYNPGPMNRIEQVSRRSVGRVVSNQNEAVSPSHWLLAIIPIFVLTSSIPLITYLIGADTLFPFTLEKFATAYGEAESYVPQILVLSSMVASVVAGVAFWRSVGCQQRVKSSIASTYIGGIRDLIGPVAILMVAWMLGAAISELGAADLLSELLKGRIEMYFLPLIIFGVGALISFSTGTSWGTMGILMPLAIPVIFAIMGDFGDLEREGLVIAAIGAVFSGAVFGDHCSPFSDTTIVSSVAAGVEPIDHVRTQFPFAVIAAIVAALCGFLPLGFGLPAWVCLLMGTSVIFGLSFIG